MLRIFKRKKKRTVEHRIYAVHAGGDLFWTNDAWVLGGFPGVKVIDAVNWWSYEDAARILYGHASLDYIVQKRVRANRIDTVTIHDVSFEVEDG